jgi:hypothetical protein
MAFMDNYEGNKDRNNRWIATYPQGRIEAYVVEFNAKEGYVLVQAKGWRNQIEIQPADIDYAYGFIEAYPDRMKRWFVEDTITSAKMRVMANLLGGTEKATAEVMSLVKSETPAVEYDYWTTKHGEVPSFKTRDEAEAAEETGWAVNGVPMCAHGSMRWNQSKPDSPKAWAGYFCSEKIKEKQCKPTWYVLTSDGTFKPQV